MSESRTRFLLDSLVGGLIGYSTVAIFFALSNVVEGRSAFYTAALLGSDLFYRLDSLSQLAVTPGPIFAFNGVHLLLFLMAGAFMAWLALIAERIQAGWYLVLGLFFIVMPHVLGIPVWFREPVRAQISLWHLALASTLAALAMTSYLLVSHPKLRAVLRAAEGGEIDGGGADDDVTRARSPAALRS